jgi:hypothetical protein
VCRGDLTIDIVQISMRRTNGLSITRKAAVHSCGITEELENMFGISQHWGHVCKNCIPSWE